MIDPENRALVVENVQNLELKVIQSIIGKLASHGADYHILPRSDIRIHFEKEEDELTKLLRSLPADIRYGFFRYQELFDFTKAYTEGQNVSEESIQRKVSLLWNKFANGGGVYAGEWDAPGARVDIIVDEPNEPTRWFGDLRRNAVDPHSRNMFSLSLDQAVEVSRGYAEYASGPKRADPLFGVGRETMEAFAHFALSRININAAEQ